jgi:hypothetical protein
MKRKSLKKEAQRYKNNEDLESLISLQDMESEVPTPKK